MTSTKKRRARKKFRYINRKKINKRRSTVKAKIQCDVVKKEWDNKQSVKHNMQNMGLAFDSNASIKIPTLIKGGAADNKSVPKKGTIKLSRKGHVAKSLEDDAKAPRERLFRLPNSQVQWITYLMDKYDEDYKAMQRDIKNYNQETWRQLRAKVKQFKGIPEQYEAYLQSKLVP